MSNFPCKDCLTLSICKARAHFTNFQSPSSVIHLLSDLSDRCSTMDEYIHSLYEPGPQANHDLVIDFYDLNMERVQEMCKYLTDNVNWKAVL